MGTAVKLSDGLVAAAREESRTMSRSMTRQIEHWARIGRMVEQNPLWDHRRVRQALKGELAFDELGTRERLVYLAQIEDEMHLPDGDAEFAAKLANGEA